MVAMRVEEMPIEKMSTEKMSIEKMFKKKKKAKPAETVSPSNGGVSVGEPPIASALETQTMKKKKKEKEMEKEKEKTWSNNKKAQVEESATMLADIGERSSGVEVKGPQSVPEPVGMQIYWNLSSVDESVREAAAGALVRELIGAQRNYEDRGLGQEEKAAEAVILGEANMEEDGLKDCAPAVQYALRRLVRGVASSREGARQGFALALAAVLEAMPSINGAAVVKMVDKNLEVTSSMKGQEARDALLGQLFAYGALVRSSRATGVANTSEQQELAKEVTERLLTLARKKTFLQEAAVYVLVELGEKLEGSGLEQGICEVPLFLDVLKEEPGTISPDTLFLALRLHHKLSKSIFQSCSVIPGTGNLIDIFEKDHLSCLISCLKESTSSHPRVHSVWDPLVQILFSGSSDPKSSKKSRKRRSSETETNLVTRLVTFWSTVVDESLLTSSHERKHLAMQLLLMFLPKLPTPSYVQYILSKNFVQCLLGASAAKENLLYKSAQNCIVEICKWAEGDDERRISVVVAMQQGSQGKFDHLSRTQSVKGLLSGLTTITGYQSTFQALSSLYLSEGPPEGDTFVNSSSNSKRHRSPAADPESEGTMDIRRDADAGQRRWAVEQLRALCHQALGGLPPKVFAEELIVKFMPSLMPTMPFTKEEEEAVTTLQSTMLQVSSALSQVEAGEKKDRLQAMLSLLVQLLFESRLVPSVAVETASEITICCKKAFGDLVELETEAQEDDEVEPAFMDVLVDVLLSLLAQSSAPIRSAADQVFKSFSGDLTNSGLTDLLRIVKKNTQRSRHKPVVEVDGQKDDDEDILDIEETDEDESEDESDGDEDDEDETEESEEKDKKIPGGREKVSSKRKLDESRVLEDDDEGETSDLDDETMFRMDKHLANILKQRKQGGSSATDDSKDAQTQLLHFKFRVLGLLDFFLQKNSGSMLVLTVLPSLLHVFVNSCSTDGNSQVADRVSSILQNKLFKGKQYPKGPDVDQKNLKDLLKKALKLASRSTVKRVSIMAQAACHWLLKVIQGNLEQDKDTDVEKMFSASLEDFFVHKKCRLPAMFFKELFTRNPWLGICLLGDLLEKCMTARSEFLQFESLQLAGTILGFKNGKFVNKPKQVPDMSLGKSLKSHIPMLNKVIVHILKNAPSAKPARRIESLQFCVSTLELYQILYPDKALAELIVADDLAIALDEKPAPVKSKLHTLIMKLQALEKKCRK